MECLSRDRGVPLEPVPGWKLRFPTDDEIAAELGITVSSVRTHIALASVKIGGLEQFLPRPRLFLWYTVLEWKRQHPNAESESAA